ncbi:MAG: hypothetical protein IPL61_33345 [Myxococcales bacterium]|nr:hypothetical protein [Myxococcales bacterium]
MIDAWGYPAATYEVVLDELAGAAPSTAGLQHHAFLGLGLAHAKAPRFNLYLKPAAPASDVLAPASRSPHVAVAGPVANMRAITHAIDFLLAHQSSCGQWLDFALPVGPSDAWVTAYVGLALAELPAAYRSPAVAAAIARAADWCEQAMGADHGWGYHAFTSSDADSTAHAIRFLRAAGRAVPAACVARLMAFQRVDGGFATYRRDDPDDTWGHSHADVTPAALRALAAEPTARAAVVAGVAYAAAQQRADGTWPSYWWHSHAYATRHNVAALTQLGHPLDATAIAAAWAVDAATPFDLGLGLACRAELGARFDDALAGARRALVATQDDDGGWPAAPILRLTDPRCAAPWAQPDAGTLYADPRRLFTTATVLTGLAAGAWSR